MKKSYMKIFLFELIILAILVLNSFEANILNFYGLPMFILVLDICFYFMLGFEATRKDNIKEVVFQIFIGTLSYLLIYYVAGIFFGFAENQNYLTPYGFTIFIIPLILTVIFKEHFRNAILTKCGNNKFLIITTLIVFIMFDLTQSLGVNMVKDAHGIFKYIALYVFPCISTNILLTVTTRRAGYYPSMLYLLILGLYQYLMPIVPNPSEYLRAIVDLVVPIVFIKIVIRASKKYKIEDKEITRENKRGEIFGLIGAFLVTFILIFFVSGYFKYYAISIVSNSMIPTFERGDVVVVEQIKEKYKNYDLIKTGEILAFKKDKTIVVHRIIRIVEVDGQRFYYTKGDANNFEDNWKISKKDVVGIVKNKVSKIGYPTVWFSEL